MPLPSIEETLAVLRTHLNPLETERVALNDAQGRVLREALHAERDEPAFDRSAMDGFALHEVPDTDGNWGIVRTIHAGESCGSALQPGEAVVMMTGGAVPENTARILPDEHAERDTNRVRPRRDGLPHYIRRRGEDCRAGDLLLNTPLRIGPPEAAILAQQGQVFPEVTRLPKILHLVSGDELVDPATVPAGAQIRDTNSPLVRALVRRTCGEATPLMQYRVADRKLDFMVALEDGKWKECEVLIFSGGAARGERDFAREILEEIGFRYQCAGVDLRPGKPFGFATRGSQAAFVIPGNPVSHWTVWHTLVAPALVQLLGLQHQATMARLPLAEDWNPGRDLRPMRWPSRLLSREGGLCIAPLSLASSGTISGLAGANALIYLRPDGQPLQANSTVDVEIL